MTTVIRVPDHIAERIEQESEEMELSRGAVLNRWAEAADTLDSIQSDWREAMQTRGGGDE